MIRKPQPKEAARAITELLARNGFAIPHALSLEVLATVEGFNDWNTMAAAIRGGTHLTPAALDADVGPEIPKSAGPFKVYAGEVYYDTLAEHTRACAAASLLAADNLDANGRLVRVLDAKGNLVAAYIAADSTIHTYSGIALDGVPPLPELSRFIQNAWDEEDVVPSDEQLRIILCDNLEIALKTDNDSFMGYCEYVRTESGRVPNPNPSIVPVFYRQDGVFKVNPELRENLRLSLERILPQ